MSKRWFDHRYDDKSGEKEWHPLFGLIGSVLWNELQGEIDTHMSFNYVTPSKKGQVA